MTDEETKAMKCPSNDTVETCGSGRSKKQLHFTEGRTRMKDVRQKAETRGVAYETSTASKSTDRDGKRRGEGEKASEHIDQR